MPISDPSTVVNSSVDSQTAVQPGASGYTQYNPGTNIVVNEFNNTYTTVNNVVNNPSVDLGNITASKIKAQSAAPSNPIEGQIYFDIDDDSTYVWSGTMWVKSSGAQTATSVTSSATGNVVSTTVQGAITELDDEKVNKSGDTMTGYLTLHADPSALMHAVTKKFVL